ncbi:MAG: UDP-2,3-diacylglucosamine diphosphatase LpxI [Nitrospirae bacterium]|nr:UDP-2,3-diacylglucosamine diphosphatase LpxI [Nitrospirota bacterium]MCL5421050.1 UDP-2,3-diacylglucosamine diphosphatase LpxI [Nitrospirota bacterium]
MTMKRDKAANVIGLIAGRGELPKAVAEEAREKGFHVVAVALEHLADKKLASHVDEIKWVNVGKLGTIIESLKRSGATKAVMAGKVPKSLLYKGNITPDLRAMKLLFTLKDRSDDSILLAITKELEKDGITLLNTTDFCQDMLTPEGLLTEEGLTEDEWKDIRFGWKIAREMGKLDIGQTVVVKGQAVMAVEAIEGTDEAIKRGGFYAHEGAVVVKVSKPHQDMRFDVPVVGLDTLRAMVEVRARVLALEAKKSIVLQKKRLLREAEEAGISVVGFIGERG